MVCVNSDQQPRETSGLPGKLVKLVIQDASAAMTQESEDIPKTRTHPSRKAQVIINI